MLNKKELSELPLLPFPKRCGNNQQNYVTVCRIELLPKSGTVLVADMYRRSDKMFTARFISDGSSYYTCIKWPADSWTKQNPAADYWHRISNFSPESDTIQAEQFLGQNRKESWRTEGVLAVVDAFISNLSRKKRDQAADRREELRKQHFAMYPAYPEDLEEYCDENVFEYSYIFFNKLSPTGRRYGRCGHCGKSFRLAKDVKHNQETTCPKCGIKSLYKAAWYTPVIEETAKICITAKVEGQLLIRWTDVYRIYKSGNAMRRYRFSDYAYNLYLRSGSGRETLYAYGKNTVSYYSGSYWKRYPNGTPNLSDAYIYSNNLNQVFGEKYYNCNLQQGLCGLKRKICFLGLLSNLEKIPAAEYLFKLKLPLMAECAGSLTKGQSRKTPGFTQTLGVSKQLLPMYQKMAIGYAEHYVIRSYGKWISMEEMQQYRKLKPNTYDYLEVARLMEKMSFGKFVRYFSKQQAVSKKSLKFLMEQYKDYLSMGKTIGIDLSRKDLRFPTDICKSHDMILKEFNKIKFEKENDAFVKAVKPIYEALPVRDFANDQYCIVLPQLRTDLTAEGQTLGHCVGSPGYRDSHMKGTRMIFFVRLVTAPEKPFFTMQIDMKQHYIVQLYGKGNRPAPLEVRQFANSFLAALSPAKAQNKRRKSA